MSEITTTTPVLMETNLTAQGLEVVENFLSNLIKKWEEDYETKSKWLWFFKTRVGLAKVSRFTVSATDALVVFIEKISDPAASNQGVLKKSVVIGALDKLYDKVIAPNLPLPAKPVGWIIRYVVVHVVLSTLIDFMVAKYNQGCWEPKPDEVETFMTETPV